MSMVCAVVFQRQGRLYYADPGELQIAVGDRVLYPTEVGPEVAEVAWAPEWVSDDIGGPPVLGREARRRRPREGGFQPQAPGHGAGRGKAADPRARAADEAVRRRLRDDR